MNDFSINGNNNVSDFSIGVNTPPPIPQQEPPKQPSIYGAIPQIPTLDAVDGIKFDFNDGIRILLCEHLGKYLSEDEYNNSDKNGSDRGCDSYVILKEIKNDKRCTSRNSNIRKVVTYKYRGERYGKFFCNIVSDLCCFASALCGAAKANFI